MGLGQVILEAMEEEENCLEKAFPIPCSIEILMDIDENAAEPHLVAN